MASGLHEQGWILSLRGARIGRVGVKRIRQHRAPAFLTMAVVFLAPLLVVTACDQPRIFATKEEAVDLASPLRGSNGDPVITMLVTGGIAGVNQQLVVDSNGFISFADGLLDSPRYTNYLTAAEYADLQAKFLNNDFFRLRESYTAADVADAFYYDLTFRSHGLSHRVVTDYLSAPSNLREIIDALNAIIDKLTRAGLQLTITSSTTTLRHGQTVKLSLAVKNLAAGPLTLHFRSGRIFDFFAAAQSSLAPYQPAKVWSWAHDKAFSLALEQITLAAGETRSYDVEWDGRDNAGQLLKGDFVVGAELASVPGGSTRLLPLRITE